MTANNLIDVGKYKPVKKERAKKGSTDGPLDVQSGTNIAKTRILVGKKVSCSLKYLPCRRSKNNGRNIRRC